MLVKSEKSKKDMEKIDIMKDFPQSERIYD